MVLWQEPWTEENYGEAQSLLSRLRQLPQSAAWKGIGNADYRRGYRDGLEASSHTNPWDWFEKPDMPQTTLRVLLDAIEIMDQKITPYGEREDGTIQNYIVADSTWHRVLAAARAIDIIEVEHELHSTARYRRAYRDAMEQRS